MLYCSGVKIIGSDVCRTIKAGKSAVKSCPQSPEQHPYPRYPPPGRLICGDCALHKLEQGDKASGRGLPQALTDSLPYLPQKSFLLLSGFQIGIGGKLLLPAEVGIDGGDNGSVDGTVLRPVQPPKMLPCLPFLGIVQIQPQGGHIQVFHTIPPAFLMRPSASAS